MGVVIKSPTNEKIILVKWEGFKEVENNIWKFRAYDSPIALSGISGKSEIVEMISFSGGKTGKDWIPEPVTYDFYLVGWTRFDASPDLKYKFQVTFTKESIEKIRSNLKEGMGEGKWVRQHMYGGDARYLSTHDFN